MNTRSSSKSPFAHFEIYRVNSTEKRRHSDSPTSSILKTPTAIFVTTRGSSAKRLKFANGPVDLQSLKNNSNECSSSLDSSLGTPNNYKSKSNGEIITEESTIEVAVSPVKTMQVSPDSWKAFLEYKKYNDYANETEKTDYTYSRMSKFRHKEIIPGFLIRPNLSRASISSSRKSSLSLPSDQSTTLSDSYFSYDFKVDGSSLADMNFDYNQSENSVNKSSRSKYYLRSTGDADSGEIDSSFPYSERGYLTGSVQEPMIKKSYRYMTGSPVTTESSARFGGRYLATTRSLDLDDADIDEVDDDNSMAYHGMNNQNNEWLEKRNAALGRAAKSSNVFTRFITAIFLYLSAVGTRSRNLFSRYILRRKDDDMMNQDFGYSSGSGSPWLYGKSYASPYYNSVSGYYRSQGSWYQRLFAYLQDRWSQTKNFIMGSGTRYGSYHGAAYGQRETSKRWKLWWLLIPLLILAGLGLYKADEKYGVISNQYKALDCRTNGFLTAVEDTVRPMWRTGYLTYKRAAASATCYANDSWERLKLPFGHLQDWASAKFGNVHSRILRFMETMWTTFTRGFWTILTLLRDTLLNLWYLVLEFLTDFISAFLNLFAYAYNGLRDAGSGLSFGLVNNFLSALKGAVLNVGSYLYLLLFGGAGIKMGAETSRESTCYGQKELDRLTSEMADFKSITWDLSDVKKKIDALELEFRTERESIKNRNLDYDKRLEDNYLTLQKYQATVNNALMASKRPGQVSGSSVQYLLDNHSEGLKQWIMQNFMLKKDSPQNLDENKVALLMAEYSNKSGADLLNLKEEFRRFILSHKAELETLRRDVSVLATTNVQGGDVSVAYIKKLVGDAIKLYDADKTGRVDYALETAGGQVQSIRCTETYIASPKSYVLLGWAVYTKTSSPRDAITPGTAAGQCWAFVGSQGFLVLQLSHTIEVTGFTMEHISRLLVPRGHIESAPKNFSMWGLKNEYDVEPYLFGEYVYLDNDETLQYFPVQYPTSNRYNMVELKITSNHGNPNYTCLYRIRVHGDILTTKP